MTPIAAIRFSRQVSAALDTLIIAIGTPPTPDRIADVRTQIFELWTDGVTLKAGDLGLLIDSLQAAEFDLAQLPTTFIPSNPNLN